MVANILKYGSDNLITFYYYIYSMKVWTDFRVRVRTDKI